MREGTPIKLILSAILLILLVLLGWLIHHFYFYIPDEIVEVPLPNVESVDGVVDCSTLIDNYIMPDFNKLETKLSASPMVKDTPSDSRIVIKLYHIIDGCKVWDKAYLLRDGTIKEQNIESDVEITISSSYVEKLATEDLCDVISEARLAGDLSEETNIEVSQLAWRYKSMLKHRECLGI